MNKIFLFAAIIISITQVRTVLAQSNDKRDLPDQKDKIIAIEQRWVKSYMSRDTAFLISLWADEAKFISTSGEVTTKKSEINELKRNVVTYNSFETTEVDPLLYGNTAVVTSKSHINATLNSSGKTIDLQVRGLK